MDGPELLEYLRLRARAQELELELVGGGEHDWAILLANWNWLTRDQALADAIHLLGVALYALAIGGGWIFLRQTRQPPVP